MSNLMLTKNGKVLNRNDYGLGNLSAWNSFIDELFSEDINNYVNKDFNSGMTSPKVNIRETDEAFTLDMAVPGFKKSDFMIDIENEVLSVSTEIKSDKEASKENYTRKEFGYASFKRTFILPETVEEDHIEASYTDGILSLNIPKKEEARPKPARTIKIS